MPLDKETLLEDLLHTSEDQGCYAWLYSRIFMAVQHAIQHPGVSSRDLVNVPVAMDVYGDQFGYEPECWVYYGSEFCGISLNVNHSGSHSLSANLPFF